MTLKYTQTRHNYGGLGMLKKSKKWFAGLLCIIMMMTLIPGNFVFGEETTPENDYLGVARKSQYVLYASSKENGIQLNGKNYVINGNVDCKL